MDAGTALETELDRSYSCETDEPQAHPMVNGFGNKKRKHDVEPISASSSKKAKHELLLDQRENLVTLPDDVLLIILSHLEHYSLCQLKATCLRFSRLCEDYTLWRKVDFSENPASSKEFDFISANVHKETKVIRVLGKTESFDNLTPEWFNNISETCPHLEKLSLPNHVIDCKAITINNFPSSITSLDLSNTSLKHLPEERSYFKDISVLIPNLKVLILSNCAWFEPHSLMAISKCKHLEELRVNDCVQVKDCLAYCGLSTRGGFQTLRTLDLRRCLISNSELVCFSSVPTLKNLYLENAHQSTVFIDPALIVMCAFQPIRADNDWDVENVPLQRVQIEKLAIRHYQLLTDGTLLKLAQDAHTLVYLDVTGSGVSKTAIQKFRDMRPQVKLLVDNVNGE